MNQRKKRFLARGEIVVLKGGREVTFLERVGGGMRVINDKGLVEIIYEGQLQDDKGQH